MPKGFFWVGHLCSSKREAGTCFACEFEWPVVNFSISIKPAKWAAPYWERLWGLYYMKRKSVAAKSRTKAPCKEQILTIRGFCLTPAPSSCLTPQNRLFLFLAFIPVIIKANIPTLHQKYLIPFFVTQILCHPGLTVQV